MGGGVCRVGGGRQRKMIATVSLEGQICQTQAACMWRHVSGAACLPHAETVSKQHNWAGQWHERRRATSRAVCSSVAVRAVEAKRRRPSFLTICTREPQMVRYWSPEETCMRLRTMSSGYVTDCPTSPAIPPKATEYPATERPHWVWGWPISRHGASLCTYCTQCSMHMQSICNVCRGA